VVCFHGYTAGGTPRPDFVETSDAAWFDPLSVEVLPVEPSALMVIRHALSGAPLPFLG